MVQLENAVRHGQANPASFGLGSEIEIKDFIADFLGNACAFIGYAQDGVLLFLFKRNPQPAPIGHGLRTVLNHINYGLLEQVGVHVRDYRVRRKRTLQSYIARGQFLGCKSQNVADDLAQVLFVQLQIRRDARSPQAFEPRDRDAGFPRR